MYTTVPDAVSKKKGGLGRKGIPGNLLCMKEKFPKMVRYSGSVLDWKIFHLF